MKTLKPSRVPVVVIPLFICLVSPSRAWAQNTWVEPSLAPVPATVADFPKREGLKSLQPSKKVQGTLASLSNGILALRPLPDATNNDYRGLLRAHFVPLTLAAGQRAYGPRILPDGSAVLFRVSGADGGFHIYKYGIKERSLKRVTANSLAFDRVELASDGRHAAVVRGVDTTGAPVSAGSGQLVLLDLNSGKETPVAKTDAAGWGGWTFLTPATLVYAAMPADDAFPALYTVEAKAGATPKLLAKKAWRPLPSPDGGTIAFFGAENPNATDDALRLSSRWDENPRGSFVSVMNSDGTDRKSLWRQDGAYPLLQWSGDALLTLKNRRWVADMGEHRIDRYDASRADDYKGGLFGVLDLDGAWRWTALLREGSVVDYQVYQVYPNTKVDFEFDGLGQSGDAKHDYFTARISKRDAGGEKKADTLWFRHGGRQFSTVAQFEGSDGLDFHDESGPNARPTGIKAFIEANPQGEAIAAAAYKANQATQNSNIEAAIFALKATLPDPEATRKATYALLEAKAGAPIVAPPPQENAGAWLKARTAELFPQTDKAQRDRNSLLLTGEALHVAEQLLASADAKSRQKGFDLAKSLAENRLSSRQSEALRGVLLGWIYPNIELARTNSQLVPVLNNLARGTELDPAVKVAVLRLQLEDASGAGLADSARIQLAEALSTLKRFDEADAVLAQITNPAMADKVARQKAMLATLRGK